MTPRTPKRMGRPPKFEGCKRLNLTFRITDRMRERLGQLALADGLSLSEVVERRLEASFDREDLETTLRRIMRDAGQSV